MAKSTIKRAKKIGYTNEIECCDILNTMFANNKVKGIAYRYLATRACYQPIDILVDSAVGYVGVECKARTVKNVDSKLRFTDISRKNSDGEYQIESQVEFLNNSCRKGYYYFLFSITDTAETVRVFVPHKILYDYIRKNNKSITVKYIIKHGYVYDNNTKKLFEYLLC